MSSLSRRRMLAAVAAAGGAAVAAPPDRATATQQPAPAQESWWPQPAITVRPDDPQYADLTRGFNERWAGTPDYIRVVNSTSQVVEAVSEAVQAGKRVAVRSGGYCFEDFVTNADVRVVVDMSQMSEISFDPVRRAVMVEPGALAADMYEVLYTRWGVVVPAGICQNVGIGGHIVGGAYGALNRLHGLAVDHLYAVEVVVVDKAGRARAVVATREADDPNRDLWWAHTGGGGGNFGVITRYWFRSPGAHGSDPSRLLPRPPSQLLVHVQTWPWAGLSPEGFARLVRNTGAFFEANSGPASPYRSLFSHLRLSHMAVNGRITLAAQLDATSPDSERLMAEFTAALGEGIGVQAQTSQHRVMPWLHNVWWNGLAGTNPTDRAKFKSAYLRTGFTDAQIAGLHRQVTRPDYQPHLGATVQIAAYGGKVNTVSPTATAVPQRDSVMKVMWNVFWHGPADDDRHLNWIREGYRDTFGDTGGVPVPNRTTDGCFVNYADVDLNDLRWNTSGIPWHDLYYGPNYRRLRQIKTRWDPRNVFRHAQSIQPIG
jgi:hypothetical protein